MTIDEAVARMDEATFNRIIMGLLDHCSSYIDKSLEECPVCQLRFGLVDKREGNYILYSLSKMC